MANQNAFSTELSVQTAALANIVSFDSSTAILDVPFIQDIDSATAFIVRTEADFRVFVVDTASKIVYLSNATKFRGFSDNGVTETFSIDGATGTAQFDGSITSSALVNKTANYTATANDRVITADATSGIITITLPAVATALVGKTYTVKKTDATNNVVLDGNASETIDGATTKTITTQYGFLTIVNTGAAWVIVSSGGTIT